MAVPNESGSAERFDEQLEADFDERFDAEVRAFLEANLPKRAQAAFVWGEGSDRISVVHELADEDEATELRKAREWRRTRYEAGLGWISGPVGYGGRGLPSTYAARYDALESAYDAPEDAIYTRPGVTIINPTIFAHGSQEAKDQLLRPILRGDVVACQLFSEPDAGSDLANVQTRAVRDGDEWVITGQKVWTSGAHYSDVGELLARTDPSAPKHKGITAFLVDLHAPGVTVRPLRQITGGASFNEVFLDEVRVRDAYRLGDPGQGWAVAMTTLMNERAAIGSGAVPRQDFAGRLIGLARHLGRTADPVVRQGIARLVCGLRTTEWMTTRTLARVPPGEPPGPELSLSKLALSGNLLQASAVAEALLGARLTADTGEWGMYAWAEVVLGTSGMRIGGGTDEIVRNIIGERVLGLPRDPA